jgi:uncharacterized protein with GYD domain
VPSYIVMFKWTPQGLKDIKQSPSRLDAGRKAFEHTGLKIKEFYMVMGQYDCIAVAEAPDDAALARAILSITSQGSITTETCRAFTEAEYREIVAALP